jgi:hypothetical protein
MIPVLKRWCEGDLLREEVTKAAKKRCVANSGTTSDQQTALVSLLSVLI